MKKPKACDDPECTRCTIRVECVRRPRQHAAPPAKPCSASAEIRLVIRAVMDEAAKLQALHAKFDACAKNYHPAIVHASRCRAVARAGHGDCSEAEMRDLVARLCSAMECVRAIEEQRLVACLKPPACGDKTTPITPGCPIQEKIGALLTAIADRLRVQGTHSPSYEPHWRALQNILVKFSNDGKVADVAP